MEDQAWPAPHVRSEEPGSRSGHSLHGRERMEQLLAQMLEEQRKTNRLLLMLVEALSEESEQDEESRFHLDGTPIG